MDVEHTLLSRLNFHFVATIDRGTDGVSVLATFFFKR